MGDCDFFAEGLPQKSREKALKAAEKPGAFVRLGPLVVFMGEREDHLLIPPHYCSCTDFKLNSLIRKRRGYCYHIYAYCLAERLGKVTPADRLLHKSPPLTPPIHIVLRLTAEEVLRKGRAAYLRRLLSSPPATLT